MDARQSPWADDTSDTTNRDTENSRDSANPRYESDAEWERVLGARDMEVSCFWDFADDQIEAKHDGVTGHGDTVIAALEDLCEQLRHSD